MEQLEAKPQRQSQVQEQINNLERNLGLLHDSINTLVDRLSSVLKQPEAPKEGESKDRTKLILLASTIQNSGDSVRSANYKVEDILDRIEL